MIVMAKDINLVIHSVMAAMTVKGAICRDEFLPLEDQGNRYTSDKIHNKLFAILQYCLMKVSSSACQ
jgi:hypothetical protein